MNDPQCELPKQQLPYATIAKMIDHSLLQPELTDAQLDAGCEIARKYDVASVCIKPYYVRRCAELLSDSTVEPSTTIGFPHGGHSTRIKLEEARQALSDGATELDMVVNVGKVLSGDWIYVGEEIRAITQVTHDAGQIIKLIFENCFLSTDQKQRLCDLCNELRVDYAKTSTGYGTGGATIEDLTLMRARCDEHVKIKAAGGIRTFDQLLEVQVIGVSRVGATRTADILDECSRRLSSDGN